MNSLDIEIDLRKFVAPEYIFGVNARNLATNYCQKLGAQKVLVVTDKTLNNTCWIQELEENLAKAGVEYVKFINFSANPRDYEVMEGAAFYTEMKCNLILAFGGGSVLDGAKGIGIISTNNKKIADFEGVDKILNPIPPLVCIPTTGGTSADVSQFAIINNTVEKYKMAIISKALVPDVALIDPAVLTTMDHYLTACTGMDALSHAFEAFVSNANSPFTDLYALEAIQLIHQNLYQSIQQPNNIQYRAKIMLASLYAGLAFSNASLGCVHSLAHSLGGYLNLPHGECNAILLSHVIDFNFDYAINRYKKIAETLNIPINTPENQIKKELIRFINELKQRIGINATLKSQGVTSDIIGILAKKAINDPCNATNPHAPTIHDLETIYSQAM